MNRKSAAPMIVCIPGREKTMIARRIYSPIPLADVTDDGGPVRCIGPAVDMPAGWYRVRSLRTGVITMTHESRMVEVL